MNFTARADIVWSFEHPRRKRLVSVYKPMLIAREKIVHDNFILQILCALGKFLGRANMTVQLHGVVSHHVGNHLMIPRMKVPAMSVMKQCLGTVVITRNRTVANNVPGIAAGRCVVAGNGLAACQVLL